MVKIPSTIEGLPAVEEMLYEGININITLIFSVERYRKVAAAFLKGLERRVAEGKPIDRLASVASVFVSRVELITPPSREVVCEIINGESPEQISETLADKILAEKVL